MPTSLPVPETTTLAYNQKGYSGTIPSQLGLLTKLTDEINLGRNSLTGTIPSELGALTGAKSGGSWGLFRYNKLSGTIPSQVR